MMDDLNTLADRVEAASGPDRDLELAIAVALGWSRIPNPTMAGGLVGRWHRPDGTLTGHDGPPYWTGSIDAALTLVPKDHEWSVNWFGNSCAEVSGIPEGPPHYGCAATAPLALTAAALRAGAKP